MPAATPAAEVPGFLKGIVSGLRDTLPTGGTATASTGGANGASQADRPQTREDRLLAWRGQDASDLIAAWGIPTRTAELPRGETIYVYLRGKTTKGTDMSGFGRLLGMKKGTDKILDSSGKTFRNECEVQVKVSRANTVQYATVVWDDDGLFSRFCDRVIKPLPDYLTERQNALRAAPRKPFQASAREGIAALKGQTLVAGLQLELSRVGYNPGPVDGLFGNKTALAIRSYQRDAGLPVDGLPTVDLLKLIKGH